ncbi:LOW QUALITY PROTEIN: hypothetical protein CVT25_015743 [Psilocybe cyanescens]|uniref:DNA 3'-5' helicase n=1 Tax=Psilocybe cyanescens TaxID=93625 RepID=A0A409WRW6_PSICY|nr:LOW QUALITY PROTEIN: hypothetical protein CVT25_015743 [Psilocybe cyanescens]
MKRNSSPDNRIYLQSRVTNLNSSTLENMQGPQPRGARNSAGMRLHPVSNLPDVYRGIFKFGVFNAVQTTCFQAVTSGDKNIVSDACPGFNRCFVCTQDMPQVISDVVHVFALAPTGSGKTALFELGIIRMLDRSKSTGTRVKCVYVAPTKVLLSFPFSYFVDQYLAALCSERFQDWVTKFEPIGLKCCELTGDTVVFGRDTWGEAKNATIMSCEKWDSLTRNWHEHESTLSQIQLFLVDETTTQHRSGSQLNIIFKVHVLNESRGSTLEVVISRMKFRGSSIRFLLVSATVPNIEDVGHWIGSGFGNSESAQVFKWHMSMTPIVQFSDDYRPCQLTRHVVGIPRRNGWNDFQFGKALDSKLFSVLQQFSTGKPILVFCSTRKGELGRELWGFLISGMLILGVFDTAEKLMKDFGECEQKKLPLPWSHPPKVDHIFQDRRLSELASVGIGVHHAGITMDDRRATEHLYMKRFLRILIATSPSEMTFTSHEAAHMVVIKGVRLFQNNASKEYSDLDVMQMLGRAPSHARFFIIFIMIREGLNLVRGSLFVTDKTECVSSDKDGIAVILCESELEQKYRTLVQGKTVLESSLHINLAEHINSEIGLGTITDIESAKSWLRGSFLYQRMQKNPNYYSVGPVGQDRQTQGVDDVVMESVALLTKTHLVEHTEYGSDVGKLSLTQYGEIMSKYILTILKIMFQMEIILALQGRASLRDIKRYVEQKSAYFHSRMGSYIMIAHPTGSRTSSCELLKNGLDNQVFCKIFNVLKNDVEIRFPVKKVEKTQDKVFILAQAVLGGISLNSPEYKSADSQPHMEAFSVFKHMARISRGNDGFLIDGSF